MLKSVHIWVKGHGRAGSIALVALYPGACIHLATTARKQGVAQRLARLWPSCSTLSHAFVLFLMGNHFWVGMIGGANTWETAMHGAARMHFARALSASNGSELGGARMHTALECGQAAHEESCFVFQ